MLQRTAASANCRGSGRGGQAKEGLAKITELRGCQNRQIYGCRVLCDLQKSILRFWPLLACFLRKSANIASSSLACPSPHSAGKPLENGNVVSEQTPSGWAGGARCPSMISVRLSGRPRWPPAFSWV